MLSAYRLDYKNKNRCFLRSKNSYFDVLSHTVGLHWGQQRITMFQLLPVSYSKLQVLTELHPHYSVSGWDGSLFYIIYASITVLLPLNSVGFFGYCFFFMWVLFSLIQGPVFFYYGLSNYFQNYRRYGASKDDNQLYGDLSSFTVS